ncbi:MAG: hypothetical protein GVY16_11230 [Planctomycetes bacterium]|jgi:hypothetical protein|nr:hypothetical protein [Phycisphaerae bacterium]NBB96296.1 hypothetical protein [Planctomycetota bacterium]
MPRDSKSQPPDERDIAALEAELSHFREEKEKVRRIIGEIGGKESNDRDRYINVAFVFMLLVLLAVDVLRHYFVDAFDWFPPLISLEVGVLLVSLKIIWMIHKQAKVEHFQFWILNSIEFRLTELSRRLSNVERDDR